MDKYQRSHLSKLRRGTLPLQVELGRFARPKVALEERICHCCNTNSVEDEVHFLVVCPLYSDLRYDLWLKIIRSDPSFIQLRPVDQLIYLMASSDLYKPLAALITHMFRRRQRIKT